MSSPVPLYKRLRISRAAIIACMFCAREFFGHALSAHVCHHAPHPTLKRRVLRESEWRASIARMRNAGKSVTVVTYPKRLARRKAARS